jgi:hypothetical protein
MNRVVALSIVILVLSSTFVSASGNGGENQSMDVENTEISSVHFSSVFEKGEDFSIQLYLDEGSNVTLVRVQTQICVNSGLCYPPEYQDMVKSGQFDEWTASVSSINDQTYVNWNFLLIEGENETRIPEVGFGWKVWSDCWNDGEKWGGIDDSCWPEEEKSVPSIGVVGTLSVIIAAIAIRRD